MRGSTRTQMILTAALAGVALATLVPTFSSAAVSSPSTESAPETSQSFIVQGRDLAAVSRLVRDVGGEITHELGIIHAVGARLTATQRERLASSDAIRRIYDDGTAEVAQSSGPSVCTLQRVDLLRANSRGKVRSSAVRSIRIPKLS